jgi:lipoyl(octanoyl) transferase
VVLKVRQLGMRDYAPVWQAMQQFTDERDKNTEDEVWLLQHPAVFTLGKAGKPEHLLNPADIPVVKVDRGGQVTFHAPGQLVVYALLDVNRLGIGVRLPAAVIAP